MENNESEKDLNQLRLQAVLAEYNDLRDEIKRRIDHRTYISYFIITLIIGLLGAYFKFGKEPIILEFSPLILVYWLWILDSSYSVHLNLVVYIREKIEGMKLPILIEKVNNKEGWINWETYYFENKKHIYGRFKIYVFFSWAIYVIYGIMIYKDVSCISLLIYLIFYGFFMLYFSYRCLKWYRDYGSKNE